MPSQQIATIPPSRLKRLLHEFRKVRVLVIGDLMLDEFLWGKVSRISPEAPVPVVWVQTESMMPGGAANVANNIRALGAQVELAGVIGSDRWGAMLLQELQARQIGTAGVVREPSRPTIVKTRVIAHHQQVVRVDREHKGPMEHSTVEQVVALVKRQLRWVDAIIVEDYGKGVISRALLEQVIPLARSRQKIITVDPKEEHFDLYHGVTSMTPNRAEASGALGRELETEEAILQAGEELLRRLHSESVLITLGEDGMCLFEKSGRRTRIPTVAQEVFDVAGAGDTVIATFTLALAAGAPMPQAAQLANLAAGIVVGKLGVASTSPEELLARVNGQTVSTRKHGVDST
ncbi:MAG: D-glycero-beta-D-manno-heptose-7-phosphate kinase [Candidatus Omnitrophica bacterium]|nr:D-glycero-beta-D-manno-heptose-7-phosphate kinase [Candidatus Omnitrophota bacterium]